MSIKPLFNPEFIAALNEHESAEIVHLRLTLTKGTNGFELTDAKITTMVEGLKAFLDLVGAKVEDVCQA